MTDVIESTFELPTVQQVSQVLAMCQEHDIPLKDLPYIWDKFQQQTDETRRLEAEVKRLNDVERKTGIANGNMERELQRLRQFSHEQALIIQSDSVERADLRDAEARIETLQEIRDQYSCVLRVVADVSSMKHVAIEQRLSMIEAVIKPFGENIR
ncbi:hypothetical protein Q6670_004005 [Salmonella enterica]|nr:hypothetical protein [Salmonella enterica]